MEQFYRHPHNLSNGDLRVSDSPLPLASSLTGTPNGTVASPGSATSSPTKSSVFNSNNRTHSAAITTNAAENSDGESIGLKLHEKFDYERLKLDFRLKEADNRFLQEELENKNRMLTMLTEGLKEV